MSSWYDSNGWDDSEDFYGADAVTRDDVNEILFGVGGAHDEHAEALFRDAFFENKSDAYIDLLEYMWAEYDIDFEDAWDWEDFRSWYDAQ